MLNTVETTQGMCCTALYHTHTEHADKMGMLGAVREQNVVRTVSERVNDEV